DHDPGYVRTLAAALRDAVRQATAAADEVALAHGRRLSAAVRDQVETTLRAAAADADARAAVLSGLLLTDLQASGLVAVDVSAAVAVPGAPGLDGLLDDAGAGGPAPYPPP
ncbi:MAG TPA: hypothetical protein PKB06_06740, partial [Actinotalea sp.]|nr:hypothetical protein [Actinotalea sp.]